MTAVPLAADVHPPYVVQHRVFWHAPHWTRFSEPAKLSAMNNQTEARSVWTTRRSKKAIILPRPVRIAYLIPSVPSYELLDVLFDEAMSRWGGRRTPIIPSDGTDLHPDYWELLTLWDADVLYSYIDLTENLHLRLAHQLGSFEISVHRGEVDYLRPRLGTNDKSLSSASVLPIFARWHALRAQSLPRVLDKERHVLAPRDLADLFGFASSSLSDFTILPHGHRVSLRPPNDEYAPRFGSAEEITYIENLEDLETRLANERGLLCMAQMCDMFAPCLSSMRAHRMKWDEHLSLVVGDEVSDRLLFWNGIHRYNSLVEAGATQLLRISPTRFANGLPDWLKRLCSAPRNRRHLHGNAAPQTVVRTCSVDAAVLERIAAEIGAAGPNMSSTARHGTETLFEPLQEHGRTNERGHGQMIFLSSWQGAAPKAEGQVRFERDEFEVPLTLPYHLKEATPGPTTRGAWIADLRIDRNEDHSAYESVPHRWMFPRRLRLDAAVRVDNYGNDAFALPPRVRPTEQGDLAIWDALSWKRPLISMPSDLKAFSEAVGVHHLNTPLASRAGAGLGVAYRFSPVQVSDKGRDLLGVLQLFRSLPEALIFLISPFWLSVVRRLIPTEAGENPQRVRELVEDLRHAFEQGGDAIDFDRLAQRTLEKTAAWRRGKSKDAASMSYWNLVETVPRELRENQWQMELERSVQYLRDRGFLRQGYEWSCEVCQHPNWVHLDNIVPILNCEICRVEHSSPVCGDKNVHFRLNPFVAAAFSPSSSQGPVAWTIARLASHASWSLMFAPALDIWRPGDRDRYTDIDVLASVDGKVYLLEVKRSFAGVDEREAERLLELARVLRPDFAGFAVERPRAECQLEAGFHERIERGLATVDVRYLMWASDDTDRPAAPFEIPSAFGREMDWSAW